MKTFRFKVLGLLLLALTSSWAQAKKVEEVLVIDVATKTDLKGYLRIGLSNNYLAHKYDEKSDSWVYIKPCRSRRKETNKK